MNLISNLANRNDKKTLILKAAAKVFARKGFFGTVVADIALEAKIGKGTIYGYFKSKEDLFFAVFERLVDESGSKAKIGLSALSGPASERLRALGETLMKSWIDMLDLFSLMMEFWSASHSSQMRERFKGAFRNGYAEFRGLVSSLIREGIEQGEFRSDVNPESTAAALVGTWDALLLQAWFDERFDPLAASRDFVTVVLRGLSKEEQTNVS